MGPMTQNARTLALLAALTASCGADGPAAGLTEVALEAVSEVDGGVGGRSALEPPAPLSFDDAGIDAGEADEFEPDLTAHERWFGDSGWDCCTQPFCAELCDEGETATVDPTGRQICCVPSIGQCPEARESDAGP